ncbi:MAG: molybdenum cofactor guanylyltransferase [Devosia sp.]
MSAVAAVILAGGKAERLGGINKALLEVGGQRLIDRVLAAIDGCAPILLSVGRSDFSLPGLIAVPDLDTDYAGPIAGVAAAVQHLASNPPEFLLSVAADTAFFPHDFIARALPLLAKFPVVLSAYRGQDYPTNGLWRFAALTGLPAALRDGTAPHSLRRLADRIGATRLDYAETASADPFANANTPDDLAALRARAASEISG